MKLGVEVIYRCPCMLAEATLHVRFRRADEDVIEWMENALQPALGADHHRRSPACASTKTDYVKIYVPENAPNLGGPPKMDA